MSLKDLWRLQEHLILALLEVDERAKWCNSFVTISKPISTVYLCLDPIKFNQALKWLVHRGPTINVILIKLTNIHYMTIIDASSGYHSLKLNEKFFVLNHIWMPIWQVQAHLSTMWSGASMRHLPPKDWLNIKRLTKYIWYNCRIGCWWQGSWQNPEASNSVILVRNVNSK